MRHRLVIAITAAGVVFSTSGRADIMPAGHRSVKATWSVTNAAASSDFFIVAFPYERCSGAGPNGKEHLELNPHQDVAGSNYQVLEYSRVYDVQKFCSSMRLYAFAKKAFTTRKRAAKKTWYRKEGEVLTVLEPFDGMKMSQKLAFVTSSEHVRPSGFAIDFPLVLESALDIHASHDALTVTRIGDQHVRLSGVRTVSDRAGTKREAKRYNSDPSADIPEPGEAEDDRPLLARAWDRRGWVFGGLVGAAFLGLGWSRRRRRKRDPSQ